MIMEIESLEELMIMKESDILAVVEGAAAAKKAA